MIDLHEYFDRVVVVNLKRRPERLTTFNNALWSCGWPFRAPEVFEAVDGNRVPAPFGWSEGSGTFGCLESHRRILQQAIMDDVKHLLVLEDDAYAIDPKNFAANVAEFLSSVPDDFDGLMLGGQHFGKVETVDHHVVRTWNCQRTHAYSVRGQYMRDLYQFFISNMGHADHLAGRIQHRFRIYAAEPFLMGQAGGQSDISGSHNPPKAWNPPSADTPVILFQGPRDVFEAMRAYGWHGGYTIDYETGIDEGLNAAVKSRDHNQAVCQWVDGIQWECASTEWQVPVIWHPRITENVLGKIAPQLKVQVVRATTVEDALKQFTPKCHPRKEMTHLLYLQAGREVFEGLVARGFHGGNWRDNVSGVDNGLREIASFGDQAERVNRLKKWIYLVGREAEKMSGGVLVVWFGRNNEDITAEEVQKATRRKVVHVKAASVDEAVKQWEAA